MRLIDIEPYEKDGWILQKTEEWKDCTVIKQTSLHAIPTVDAVPVPVVRCKDCKYWDRREEYGSRGTCESKNMNVCGVMDADWFCADGERHNDDD